MQFFCGTNRFVISLPFFGLVLKFPIAELWYTQYVSFPDGVDGVRVDGPKKINQRFFQEFIFNCKENWREFCFFVRTRHPLLRPTYFSLFGLVNVQSLGNHLNMAEFDFFYHLLSLTGKPGWKDCHTLGPQNFCCENGKLQIVDYGGELTQKWILEFGDQVLEKFDINYKYVEPAD